MSADTPGPRAGALMQVQGLLLALPWTWRLRGCALLAANVLFLYPLIRLLRRLEAWFRS